MTPRTFRSSHADKWTSPRAYSDESLRYLKHGPVQPLDHPRGFWSRLFCR